MPRLDPAGSHQHLPCDTASTRLDRAAALRGPAAPSTFRGLPSRLLLAWLVASGFAACAFPDYAVEQDPAAVLARLCSDGQVSDAETGVDCGGACPPCKENQVCKVANDCLTLACVDGVCRAARCDDRITNGSESDRDCGGQCERRCGAGDECRVSADCVSGKHRCTLWMERRQLGNYGVVGITSPL